MAKHAVKKNTDNAEKEKASSVSNNCDTTNEAPVESTNNVTSTENNNHIKTDKPWHIKDLTLKEFFSTKSVFKDFVNGYYYDGEEVIKEENIEVGKQSDFIFLDGMAYPVARDIYMLIKNKDNEVIAAVGIENQSKIDYQMSARIAGYDGASFRGQYEYPRNQMYCVNTVVINYSDIEWKKANLKNDIPSREGDKVFRAKMIPVELNILNLKTLTGDKIKNYGHGDLRLFFQVVYDIVFNKDIENRTVLNNILRDGDIIVTNPTVTALAIKAVTNCDTYIKLVKSYTESKGYIEGEKVNMCDVLGHLLAEKDKAVATATKEAATAKEEAANKDRKFVTYLINDGKTNEEIKKIVSDISDDFINKMRESVVTD